VANSTPIAAISTGADAIHLFYADNKNQFIDIFKGNKTDVERFYPDTNLGATAQEGKVLLFSKTLDPVKAIKLHINEEGEWISSGIIVRRALAT
jgi:hypothetical protein